MSIKMKHLIVIIITITLSMLYFSRLSADTVNNNSDNRISLNLTKAEEADFLGEMREMLASIQGVMSGIGDNNRELIINSASSSGNKMARATPESIKKKTPAAFKEIGGPTHMMFEELVVRAEDDDMETLAEFTGKLMKQCLDCHAMFKVN